MKYLSLSFFVLAMLSCSSEQEDQPITDGDVKYEGEIDSCNCADLIIDSLGIYSKGEEVYTGVCTDYYPKSTDKYIEKNLLEGALHGQVVYFDREGNELMQEMYEYGVKKRSGDVDFLNCDCEELEKVPSPDPQLPIRYFLDEIPYTGTCQKFYPESDQLYVESNYQAGLLDGTSTYYSKDGTVLYIEEYAKGTLIKTLHEGN